MKAYKRDDIKMNLISINFVASLDMDIERLVRYIA